jgi:hypothetical protein
MGFDYGRGETNIDKKTGIRYGVIHQGEVLQAWYDCAEPYYVVYCIYCGAELKKGFDAKRCPECYKTFKDGDFDECEPASYSCESKEYVAEQSADDCDIFIFKSPYYTYCDFCSPCAPGAGYLLSEGNVKAYCFGHDWFDDGKAPYKVYDVKTDKEVTK